MSILGKYWSARFERWGPRPEQVPGYTVLVPVPGDLPVFLDIALQVLSHQTASERVETLVIPDVPHPQLESTVERHRRSWDGPLRVVALPLPERRLLPVMRNPSRNHGVQLITGVNHSRATHVVLHDADLFLLKPSVLDDHYVATEEGGLHVRGVDPVWDGWYAERGVHLAATWEMCARTDWLRSFPPSLHLGHDGELLGERHTFDTTLHPQALTDPGRIAIRAPADDIVHFNYVISSYRALQRSRRPYLDEEFRILLIRLFIDLFAQDPSDYRVPTLPQLAEGLHDGDLPVVYPAPSEVMRERYLAYRARVDRILEGNWVNGNRRGEVADQLRPFDGHYA